MGQGSGARIIKGLGGWEGVESLNCPDYDLIANSVWRAEVHDQASSSVGLAESGREFINYNLKHFDRTSMQPNEIM
jgi:hypothetical protein